ncbi:MAG: AEC family transporter [Anaeroplasmataceae bacterium]
MKDLMFTLNAILPIVIVILVGYLLKRTKLISKDFFKTANKLCFRILLPILLFKNVYDIGSLENINWMFILYIIIAVIVIFILGLIFVYFFVKDPKQKGVILQSTFRSNYAIIGIPLATTLAAGMVVGMDPETANLITSEIVGNASLASAFSIPLFNILAVLSLSLFVKNDDKSQLSFKCITLNVIKNPLIQGVSLGILFLCTRMLFQSWGNDFTFKKDIPFTYESINMLAKIATPLALVALGGQFEFAAVSKLIKPITMSMVIRIIIVPATFLIIAYAIGFDKMVFPALIGIFATPVAVSSVPMAAGMGNDEELAGQIVVWSTILSTFSLFIIIMTYKAVGIF